MNCAIEKTISKDKESTAPVNDPFIENIIRVFFFSIKVDGFSHGDCFNSNAR